MGDLAASKNHNQVIDVFREEFPKKDYELFDDDGRIKRTGTLWTASAHVITAVIGCGVLSLAWAIAQLGWIAGPAVMLVFPFISYYTSCLLADCYRTGDPLTGKRNYTYMEAVHSILGGAMFKVCGLLQYMFLSGVAVGFTIVSSISMMAIKRSNCFHASKGKNGCHMSSNPYMIMFGIIEIGLSQIPDLHQIWWLSIVAAVMSITYSSIGLALGIAKVAVNGSFKGSLAGISLETVGQTEKIWRIFQALGDIAFAYSFSNILLEIQDTVKSPPSEAQTMKKAATISIMVTTTFYMLCGCMGYAAFGDKAPGNLLTGFGFYNPFWLIDIANAAIIVHLVGAYQLFCQPFFAFVEKWAATKYPESFLVTKDFKIQIPGFRSLSCKLNLFKLVWRTTFVCLTTILAMLLPFFNDIVGILGSIGFWPLTVYFPVEMYIAQKKIPKWCTRWVVLQILSIGCLLISVVAGIGSFAGMVLDLRSFRPFSTSY